MNEKLGFCTESGYRRIGQQRTTRSNHTMSDHTFNPFIAEKYGINEAIFLNTIIFWTRTNAAKKKNFHEDRYWTYGTPEFYAAYFPYFKPRLIKDIIASCIKQNALIKGNFNKKRYDRTSWYSLSDNILFDLNLDIACLQPNARTIVRNSYNGLDVIRTMDRTDYVPPIPDTYTDTETQTNTTDENLNSSSVVISTSTDKTLLSAKLDSDTRTDQQFLMACKFHLEIQGTKKYTNAQKINGLIKIIKKGFETPIGAKGQPPNPVNSGKVNTKFNPEDQDRAHEKRLEEYKAAVNTRNPRKKIMCYNEQVTKSRGVT